MHLPRLATVLTAAALALGAAACGDDDEGGDGGGGGANAPAQTEEAPATTQGGGSGSASSQGKSVFTERCSSCHTLADANATGSVGPNLDEIDDDVAEVVEQVNNGGGAMPPFRDTLSEEEIQAVAEYVVEARGGG